MQTSDYKEILSSYSNILPYTRYDSLQYYIKGKFEMTDVAVDKDLMDIIYKSYNTYRQDVNPESLSLKNNETRNNEDDIIVNYYNTSLFDLKYVEEHSGDVPVYIFPGTVLSHKFSTNNREMTLEDLFAEYYYDYIMALDTSYLLGTNNTYYFNKATVDEVTYDIKPSGLYNILPIGTEYIDEDTSTTKTIEYDGTYTPTIGELLSGEMYIVIQSPGMAPRKISFNNKTLPTLLINDDKYTNTNTYIMNNQQLLRLCDIKLYERIGFNIQWKQLISVSKIGQMIKFINTHSVYGNDISDASNIHAEDVGIRLYYSAYYENSGLPENNRNVYFITGNEDVQITDTQYKDITFGSDFTKSSIIDDSMILYTDNTEIVLNLSENVFTHGYPLPPIYTPFIKPIPGLDEHYIILHLFFGLTLVLKGFTESEIEPEPTPTTYEFSWWEQTT